MKAFYAEKDWIAERIESLEGDLRAIARMSPLAAVNYIRQGIGYDEYLIEYAAFRRMRPEELLETADELKESAAGFKTFDEWFAHIEAYKEELLRQAAQRRTETDAITLATMHSAKGLEFPIVYILDANEGITPHSPRDAGRGYGRRTASSLCSHDAGLRPGCMCMRCGRGTIKRRKYRGLCGSIWDGMEIAGNEIHEIENREII